MTQHRIISTCQVEATKKSELVDVATALVKQHEEEEARQQRQQVGGWECSSCRGWVWDAAVAADGWMGEGAVAAGRWGMQSQQQQVGVNGTLWECKPPG